MENYEDFKKSYFDLSHIDLNAYKEKQMRRRIETLISRRGLYSFEQYAEKLKADKKELEYFTDYITINVTEFLRTPEHWEFFVTDVIPELSSAIKNPSGKNGSDRKLKIWSTGCSTGEEPYSLSMVLLNFFRKEEFQILATDIDENVLKKARDGVFDEKCFEMFPEDFREKYFEEVRTRNNFLCPSKIRYRINDAIKDQVAFQKLDMTQDDFPKDCDLIVCRNVLIYFTEETKQKIFHEFCDSLKSGGILFLGHTEQIVYYRNFGLEKLAKNFYRKK